MSEEMGYARVINVRGDEDFQLEAGETLIMMDRTNPLFGNPHIMKVKTWQERDRVIAAYRKDLEADIAVQGPRYQALMKISHDIVANNKKIGLGCW